MRKPDLGAFSPHQYLSTGTMSSFGFLPLRVAFFSPFTTFAAASLWTSNMACSFSIRIEPMSMSRNA